MDRIIRENARPYPGRRPTALRRFASAVAVPLVLLGMLAPLSALPIPMPAVALGASPAGGRTAPAHAPTTSVSCRGANLRPNASNAATVAAVTLCLIDQVRVAHYLAPLRANHELQMVAAAQATDMVRQNFFAHDSPSGQTPGTLVAATHYPVHTASVSTAQNIAWGTGRYATPAHIVAAWMRSPPHREIILTGKYRDAGVGVAVPAPSVVGHGQSGATYAVELGARGL